MILNPDDNCWQVTRADRAALLIDGQAYFTALRQALERARHSIWVLGWDLRLDISLDPLGDGETLERTLARLVGACDRLEVRLLVWDWPLLYSADRQFLLDLQTELALPERIRLAFDPAPVPLGASHDKLVVIDGRLAFCGGIDLTRGRFDTSDHPVRLEARDQPGEIPHPPFHDMMLMVEGATVRSLEAYAIERWHAVTAERPAAAQADQTPWPPDTEPWWENVQVGIARTTPRTEAAPGCREIERLLTAAIRAAERSIYIENQYLTAAAVAAALKERLAEPDGPEVLILVTEQAEGVLEEAVMKAGRARFMAVLAEADDGARHRVMGPFTDEQTPINLHAKLMIVDDRMLIVGSANLANRSMGLDIECNLAIEAGPGETAARQGIKRARNTLLAEHLGRTVETLEAAIDRTGSLLAAVDELSSTSGRHVRLVDPTPPELPPELLAAARLGDEDEPVTLDRLEHRLSHIVADIEPALDEPESGLRRGLLLVGALLGMAGLTLLLVDEPLRLLQEPMRIVEPWRGTVPGALVASLVLAVAGMLFVPITALIVAVGALFGPWLGFAATLGGCLAAALGGFLLGRKLGAGTVRRWLGKRAEKFQHRFDKHGMVATAILRVVPVAPFAAVNLVAGTTPIGLADFMLGTLLGMAPGIALFSLFGDGLMGVITDPRPRHVVVLVLVVLGIAAATWLGRRWTARRRAKG